MAFLIKKVQRGSLAHRIRLKAGDTIEKINDEELIDQIDYIYFMSGETLKLTVLKPDGTRNIISAQKQLHEDLGCEFEGTLLGKQRCVNKCVFCFVDQLPKGMRQTLYFKDDDWRLSFLMGNYITLTNVSDSEFERIIKRKVSPLYISVHATNQDVRTQLLTGVNKNIKNHEILERLKRLADAGIYFHSQIVAVPGINDAQVLKQTIEDLAGLYPYSKSLAVVPVGLTKHRAKCADIHGFDEKTAGDVIDIIHSCEYLKTLGTRFVFAADEMYIKARRALPSYEEYEEFCQIENGVGLIAQFMHEFESALADATKARLQRVSVATGVDFAPYLQQAVHTLRRKLDIDITVYPIVNNFFGQSITVAGLITGQDIVCQLKGKDLGQKLLLPRSMFKEKEEVFLDDMHIKDAARMLKTKCQIIDTDGYAFIDAITK